MNFNETEKIWETIKQFRQKRPIEKNADYDQGRNEGYIEAYLEIAQKMNKEKETTNAFDIVKGIEFIAENKDKDYKTVAKGLIKLGCLFSWIDVNEVVEPNNEFGKKHQLKLRYWASLICGMRDSEAIFNERLEDFDYDRNNDWPSPYEFVREQTGDVNYTLDKVEKMIEQRKTEDNYKS